MTVKVDGDLRLATVKIVHDIHQLGVDNVLFETDYPHPICLYPVDNMDRALGGLTEEEKVKALSGNAARIYNIEL